MLIFPSPPALFPKGRGVLITELATSRPTVRRDVRAADAARIEILEHALTLRAKAAAIRGDDPEVNGVG